MAQAAPPATRPSSSGGGLRLRIGSETVGVASADAVAAAAAKANAARRLDGLPDVLNPDLIDPAKLTALLARLPDAAAPHRRVLARRALFVDPAGLRVGTSSPTTPASFAEGLALEIDDADGDPVIARAVVAVDCGLARTRAAEARAHLDGVAREVADLEARRDVRALPPARLRRYAVARAWRDNAVAASRCAPDDAAAKADRDAAEQAARSFAVPLGRLPS